MSDLKLLLLASALEVVDEGGTRASLKLRQFIWDNFGEEEIRAARMLTAEQSDKRVGYTA